MTSTEELGPLVSARKSCEALFGSTDKADRYRLYAMIGRDEISAKKIGNRWFVPQAEIVRWLDGADTS